MLENQLYRFRGRELLSHYELESGEVEVLIQSDNFLGLYAFPSRAHAACFNLDARRIVAEETGSDVAAYCTSIMLVGMLLQRYRENA